MSGYLGETIIKQEDSKYKNYTQQDFAMEWIFKYSYVDEAFHKTWLLDQVARILKGTQVIIKIAKWKDGYTEDRLVLGEPSQTYLDWIIEYKNGKDGPDTYDYDEGTAP